MSSSLSLIHICRGAVDALAFHAVHEMAAEALLTVLVDVRLVQHVVRTNQLVVMCSGNDLTIPYLSLIHILPSVWQTRGWAGFWIGNP